MTSHDLPVEEINKLLKEDRQNAEFIAYDEYVVSQSRHVHKFDIAVHGQTKTWYRCECGEWEQ